MTRANKPSRTVLVTGGAGFIGSHLADGLLSRGHRVVILDNESTGDRRNVPAEAVYVVGDTRDPDDVARAFEPGVDVVFHVAGQASTIQSFSHPEDDLATNVLGTLNVLHACIAHKVPRLIFASSMTVYGHPQVVPTPEESPCRPISYYGVTKYAAECYVHATAERNDLDFEFQVTSFRMFNVYGERQQLDNPYQGVVGIFIGNVLRGEPIQIFGDGEQSRDFVYIGDVVEAWLRALDAPAAAGQVFNLGMGQRRTIRELAHTVVRAFGRSPEDYPIVYGPPRPGDQRHMQADIRRAWDLLGWQSDTDFDQGMARTVQWAVNEPAYKQCVELGGAHVAAR